MTHKSGGSYAKGQRVQARVETILDFGVFVRLPDETKGYIRLRELSWVPEQDPASIVLPGQEFLVEVTVPESPGRTLECSRRLTLPDPWTEFARRLRPGNVVLCTVSSLVPDAAFVQIFPGVSGMVPLEELAPWKVERPEEVVLVGDRVEAIITCVAQHSRQVWLSIRERMQQVAISQATVRRLRGEPDTGGQGLPQDTLADGSENRSVSSSARASVVGRTLLVDDRDDLRVPLARWLSGQGCTVESASNMQEAQACCERALPKLVLLSLDLPGGAGLLLTEWLHRQAGDCHVAVMTSPDVSREQLHRLRRWGVAAVFAKPLDLEEIRLFLLRLARGERPALSPEPIQEIKAGVDALGGLTDLMRSERPLAQRLAKGLEQALRETRASSGIVFHRDPSSGQISAMVTTGNPRHDADKAYDLGDSPVNDVIVRGQMVYENRVSLERTERFRKLLDFTQFESCIGVPVRAGGCTEHAFFLFHSDAEAFSRYHVRDAWAASALLGVALEQEMLSERAKALGKLLLSGELAGAFGHEIYNKISVLDLEMRNLSDSRSRLVEAGTSGQTPALTDIGPAIDRALNATKDLQNVVNLFRDLSLVARQEMVDVNQVVRCSIQLQGPLLRRDKVRAEMELAADLPQVVGSTAGLQQAFSNVILNAIQHLAAKAGHFRENVGVLHIRTGVESDHGNRRVKVRFNDSGPGIHRQYWERIFDLGFSTRPQGTGLGLYLARSLVASMHGRIVVEESIVPMGTTFLVELPAPSSVEEASK